MPEGDWFCSFCVSERTVPLSVATRTSAATQEGSKVWTSHFRNLERLFPTCGFGMELRGAHRAKVLAEV